MDQEGNGIHGQDIGASGTLDGTASDLDRPITTKIEAIPCIFVMTFRNMAAAALRERYTAPRFQSRWLGKILDGRFWPELRRSSFKHHVA
jgi:hypothetical protein